MKRYYLATLATLLCGCTCDPSSIPFVTEVADCTASACRVLVSDGTRATVRRPVIVGDRITRTLSGEARVYLR